MISTKSRTLSNDTEISVIAFAKGKSKSADAFVVTKMNSKKAKHMVIKNYRYKFSGVGVRGFPYNGRRKGKYTGIGVSNGQNGELFYEAPAGSAATFFGK